MQQGLFCVMESKTEGRERAKKINEALSAIEDAPQEIEQREGQIGEVEYFIQRSNACELNENDLDALYHQLDTSEILEDEDIAELDAKTEIWRDYIPGWLGAQPGCKYPSQLHHKEIEYLQEVINATREELEAVKIGAEAYKMELEELRAIGPLAPEDAKRFNLTVDGKRDKQIHTEG